MRNWACRFILAVCLSNLYAQNRVQEAWVRHYNSGFVPGQDFATAIAVDKSGNVYVTGRSPNAPNGFDYLTIKYNAAGNQVWTARYDGLGHADDMPVAIAVDNSGNVYVTGKSSGLDTEFDCATIKYNSAGAPQWLARYNGPANLDDMAASLAIDANGNVYVTGTTHVEKLNDGSGGTIGDFLLIKYNSAGNKQWVASYNGPANAGDGAIAVALDAAGNIYVTGVSTGAITVLGTDSDFATIKYNSAGIRQWIARYHKYQFDFVTALALDPAGNVYVAGTSILGNFPNYVTIKYNSAGVEQWVTSKATRDDGFARAMAVDAAGNVYVTGTDSFDYFTVKYNTGGGEQWAARYNDRGDWPLALSVDASGNVYVTGSSSLDYATVKYNSAGVQQWVMRYNGPADSEDVPSAMTVDTAGNVYVTGTSLGLATGFPTRDYATVKYHSNGVQQWAARYASPDSRDKATAMVIDTGGNVVVTGISQVEGSHADYATIKYNSTGTQQWLARYNQVSRSNALAVDKTGNVYVAGGSSNDYMTIKYNSTGAMAWEARYNGPDNGNDLATAIAVDTKGNVYVTGWSDGSIPSYHRDYVTIKYNSTGMQQWTARYKRSGNAADYAPYLAIDAVGNVYITEEVTIKYNSLGIEQWVANNNNGFANAITVDAASNVYLTGARQNDYFTLKYNSTGIPQWDASYNGPANSKDLATAVAVDPTGQVYVTGESGSTTQNDYATIKYNSAGVQQWVARYSGLGIPYYFDNVANALAIDLSGNVYVTGKSMGIYKPGVNVFNSDFATIKYNAAGVEQWVARYSGPGYCFDEAEAIAVDAAGNVFVAGWSEGANGGGSWSVYTTVKYVQSTVDVAESELHKPGRYELLQNYPNPFNPSTTIRYALPKPGRVTLKVFNLHGQEIATLVNENKSAGEYQIQWQATDLSSGVYVYRLQAGDFDESKKLILVR